MLGRNESYQGTQGTAICKAQLLLRAKRHWRVPIASSFAKTLLFRHAKGLMD
ncbi:Uncharacterised protein [Vibrio cholerae]|nr:Uncharacterised protein [Vibrio cholerae]